MPHRLSLEKLRNGTGCCKVGPTQINNVGGERLRNLNNEITVLSGSWSLERQAYRCNAVRLLSDTHLEIHEVLAGNPCRS